MTIKIHKNAMIEIIALNGAIRTCHLKDIKEVILGTDRIESKIDKQVVSYEDAKLVRDLMVNEISLKEAINCL